MKRLYFGTDGVRGPYGSSLINEAFARRLGSAVGRYLVKHGAVRKAVIGRDTRASGPSLQQAVAVGLLAEGFEVVSLGMAPTPAVAAAVVHEGASLGVMITASHNPAADNGIKFFSQTGTKLTDTQEVEIESFLPESVADFPAVLKTAEALNAYRRTVRAILAEGALTGRKVVLDTANGATCVTSPGVLRDLGAIVIGIGDHPDGSNINAGVGSEHPESLAARVIGEKADIGIAHDGDGDRCVLCDENGGVLDGDEIVTILAAHALSNGTLAERTLVVTIQSNLGVDAAVRQLGGRVLRTQVGDRYVLEGMRASGAKLGGESSGHIISGDVSATGDGLAAALKVLEVMQATGKPLSELRQVLKKFPQVTRNLTVRAKKELASLPRLCAAIKSAENELGFDGRVLVRYSGTEPKLRFLVEGPTAVGVSSILARLVEAASAELEVIES